MLMIAGSMIGHSLNSANTKLVVTSQAFARVYHLQILQYNLPGLIHGCVRSFSSFCSELLRPLCYSVSLMVILFSGREIGYDSRFVPALASCNHKSEVGSSVVDDGRLDKKIGNSAVSLLHPMKDDSSSCEPIPTKLSAIGHSV